MTLEPFYELFPYIRGQYVNSAYLDTPWNPWASPLISQRMLREVLLALDDLGMGRSAYPFGKMLCRNLNLFYPACLAGASGAGLIYLANRQNAVVQK